MTRLQLRVLVANRGEIAVRIIRACRAIGVESVAVFTPEDRETPAPALADFAYPLPSKGYLDADAIFTAVERTRANAIHPGYGFFAENSSFIRQCEAKGIIFIGPSADAAEALGDKILCRKLAHKLGIRTLAGGDSPASTPEEIDVQAKQAGFPVLIKAAAGGGGRGIRIAKNQDELQSAASAAVQEGERLFLDGRIFIERYLESARHIEIQVLSDQQGEVVHFGERDCTVQRRRQKIIEEAPGPLTPELREKMGIDAIRLIRAVGYQGLGTVEFLIDPEGNHYLIEVNTRLQVEHPVTEFICARDLIADQIRVALGEPLGYSQKDINLQGHAIECRITAEDPAQNYMMSTGTVSEVRWPGGPGVRFDTGIVPGTKVNSNYDPLLAKLIVWGTNREDAIKRACNALEETQIHGVATNIPLLQAILTDDQFVENEIDTLYLNHFLEKTTIGREGMTREKDLAAILAVLAHRDMLPRPESTRKVRRNTGAIPMIIL